MDKFFQTYSNQDYMKNQSSERNFVNSNNNINFDDDNPGANISEILTYQQQYVDIVPTYSTGYAGDANQVPIEQFEMYSLGNLQTLAGEASNNLIMKPTVVDNEVYFQQNLYNIHNQQQVMDLSKKYDILEQNTESEAVFANSENALPEIKYGMKYLINEPRGPKYPCYECKELLHTKLSLSTHMKIHRKPHCHICHLLLSNKAEVENHLIKVHSKGPNFSLTLGPDNGEEMKKVITYSSIDIASSNIISDISNVQNSKKIKKSGRPPKRETTDWPLTNKMESEKVTKKQRKISPKLVSTTETEGDKNNTPTKRVTSRFGRRINVIVPEFF